MTKLIPILSGRCLVVELPEGATKPIVDPRACRLCYRVNGKNDWMWIPPGNWRIIGMLSEVRESDASGLVEEQPQENDNSLPEHKRRWWKNYTGGVPFPESRALESLDSAILAEGFTFQNNLRNPDDVCYFSLDRMIDDVRDYHEAQSRVLCRERCLLLGRVDG